MDFLVTGVNLTKSVRILNSNYEQSSKNTHAIRYVYICVNIFTEVSKCLKDVKT